MKVAALAGGVGGAKLADGLMHWLPPGDLTVIVNTGDDFEHLGLYICPDLDTVCYTLAGLANPATGWGRAEESWGALETIGALGGPTWFRLGDHDIGLHLERTRRLRAGETLSQVTEHFCRAFGVSARVLPMLNDPAPTSVYTIELGEISFQEYFVRHQCRPRVTGFRFKDIENAYPTPGVLTALQSADLVVICPSNPWVSIGPILAVPGIRAEMEDRLVVAVTPIIAGQTIKGPAAKMYAEMNIEPSAASVARHYQGLLRGFVLDQQDRQLEGVVGELDMEILVTDTVMATAQDRQRLAAEVLEFGEKLLRTPKR
jgi:LPPG:FO 2-phospho-L-lactate transferase